VLWRSGLDAGLTLGRRDDITRPVRKHPSPDGVSPRHQDHPAMPAHRTLVCDMSPRHAGGNPGVSGNEVANDLLDEPRGAMVHIGRLSPDRPTRGRTRAGRTDPRRMTRTRPELPAGLLARPRTRQDLRHAGVAWRDLAGPLWIPLLPGVHLWMPPDRLDAMTRIQAVVAWMPQGAVLGGWAALRWAGVDGLDGRNGPGACLDLPISVCLGPVGRVRRPPGVDLDRSTILAIDLTECRGVAMTTPARSCLDVARRCGPEEGLVVTDAALRAGLVTRAELDDAVSRLVRIKAVPAARLVAALADPRAESAPESRLRYVWVVEAGLPAPLVNPVLLGRDGTFLGRSDLLDEEAALVGEYDGEDHRLLDRHTADNVREEAFEATNLVVTRATAIDLWPQRRRLVHRLVERRAYGMARDRSRDGWVLQLPRPAS
jgi:hypothetical protein